jgi:hypothetical protein
MKYLRTGLIGLALMGIAAGAEQANGQTVPWETFVDTQSSSVCDVVNAGNAELLVLVPSRELETIDGEIVPFSFVDADGNVFIDDFPFGFLSFAEDGDGFRTLWWLAISDGVFRVVELTDFALEPVVTSRFTSEFFNVPCDVCTLIDDPDNCGCRDSLDCDDGNECTDDLCLVSGECTYVDRISVCNDGDACTEFDTCSNGSCSGVLIAGCDDDPPIVVPNISFNFCGSGAALAMSLTFMGLMTMTLIRRR